MLKWKHSGVLILSFVIGACTPNSDEQFDQEALETQSQRQFTIFVDNGLEAANRGIMELEQEAVEATSEADTVVSRTVAELRSEYEELSEEADSLVQSADAELDDERMNLRDRLIDLTKTVEMTRFELIDESEQFRDTVKRRLTELDERMYELTTDITEAGLSEEFDAMIMRLNILREDAAAQISRLEETSGDEFVELRDDVTNALSTFSARLTEAETEYETTAATSMEATMSDEHRDDPFLNLDPVPCDPGCAVGRGAAPDRLSTAGMVRVTRTEHTCAEMDKMQFRRGLGLPQ